MNITDYFLVKIYEQLFQSIHNLDNLKKQFKRYFNSKVVLADEVTGEDLLIANTRRAQEHIKAETRNILTFG